ncbi:MAG: UvrD-helicase domain-containing protein, partial [Clostridiales bacterium]|nr:UvrD-helicase domain-containing protein [Clostridiales bacterium]
MSIQLTPQQQAAVDHRGGELLVSAAAGSGKTRVLVERLLDRVEQEGLDVDRFLIITFTKAAASELRGKIL